MNADARAELLVMARRLEARALSCTLHRLRWDGTIAQWQDGRSEGFRDAARMLREEANDDLDDWMNSGARWDWTPDAAASLAVVA